MFFATAIPSTTTTTVNGNPNLSIQVISGCNLLSLFGLIPPLSPFTSISCYTGFGFTIAPHFPPNVFKFFFGENATQTLTTLTIYKSDLTGLAASANNTAESIFVGLLNRVLAGKSLIETPKISFSYWGGGRDNGKRVDTVLLNFRNALALIDGYETPDINTPINPNNY